MQKILRVDMTNLTAKFEDVPEKYKYMGGRWITSAIVADEVPPTCEPLGPFNKVVIAPGMLDGTSAPSSGRLSVGGKSPLTKGIKEANSGGISGQKLARLGIKAVVVEGQAKPGEFYVVKLSKDQAEILPADDLAGIGLFDFAAKVWERFPNKPGFVACGVAGEMKMANAGVCINDRHNLASRYAGRGGLGAVMGSKGFKALIIDDSQGKAPEVKDPAKFKEACKKVIQAMQEFPLTNNRWPCYGTLQILEGINDMGALPVRNFSSGKFDRAAEMYGEAFAAEIDKRGGMGYHTQPCMPGCVIRCSNYMPNKQGGPLSGGPLEYESAWALGPNCDISDWDVLGKLNYICNDLGLDTMEAGCTVAVAMEGGLLSFGDGEGAIKLLEEVGKGTPLGRIIGQGATFTAQAFGVSRVPACRGQTMAAYDPRVPIAMGISYATNPMGADHTAGFTLATEADFDGSRGAQSSAAFVDATGYCLFVSFATGNVAIGGVGFRESLSAFWGVDWTDKDIADFGMEILRIERNFNEAAGVGANEDKIPEFMYTEPLPPYNKVYTVSHEDLRKTFEEK
jgi:aldehyde:ferredoxin oxidoreductase